MFVKMLLGALARQRRKHLMIAFTVGLGVSLATAMLGVVFDVGDKVNQELKSYGANLLVIPKGVSMLSDLYQSREPEDPAGAGSPAAGEGGLSADDNDYLPEDQLYKIKMIFWAYNIVDFAPYLTVDVEAGGLKIPLTGTWFQKELKLPTGDEVVTGMTGLRTWWTLDGPPGDDAATDSVLVGANVAKKLDLKPGDPLEVAAPGGGKRRLTVRSVFFSGGEDDDAIYGPMLLAQELGGRPGLVQRVEVSALTTPENDLARRAAQNPYSLSRKDWEVWYCTAYVSAIAFQIEEVLTDARAKPVLQVAESEGAILQKTQLLMLLLTLLSLACSALAISNLVTANIMERSTEIGLLKALGATDGRISLTILSEMLVATFAGGAVGYAAGLGLATLIGHSVFGSAVAAKGLVIPLIVLLVFLVTMGGSLPAIRLLLRLRPAEVLHGR